MDGPTKALPINDPLIKREFSSPPDGAKDYASVVDAAHSAFLYNCVADQGSDYPENAKSDPDPVHRGADAETRLLEQPSLDNGLDNNEPVSFQDQMSEHDSITGGADVEIPDALTVHEAPVEEVSETPLPWGKRRPSNGHSAARIWQLSR